MTVSYKKALEIVDWPWDEKKRFTSICGNKPSSISKLSKNEYVSMDVLVKVCSALGVDFKDIMELVPDLMKDK